MLVNLRNLCLLALVASSTSLADIRDRIRQQGRPSGTAVTQTQAGELTLTVTEAQVRPIQNWLRTVGTVDSSGKVLKAYLDSGDATAAAVGQRARIFSADSKSSMFQAKITRVVSESGHTLVEATLASGVHDPKVRYVLEIVVDYGEFLSVPNEAIIEEGNKQIVYVQASDGSYEPREIATQLQGERYTQVLKGISAGEQVVTTGSFFIDAEYKMKGGN